MTRTPMLKARVVTTTVSVRIGADFSPQGFERDPGLV